MNMICCFSKTFIYPSLSTFSVIYLDILYYILSSLPPIHGDDMMLDSDRWTAVRQISDLCVEEVGDVAAIVGVGHALRL